ncbi:poly(U)-specific endoribonuclease-B-like isoform X1 [Lampetra planeri]
MARTRLFVSAVVSSIALLLRCPECFTTASTGASERELQQVMSALWDADVNRLKPGRDYAIDLQGRAGYVPTGSNSATDCAVRPLFKFVDEGRLHGIETFRVFLSLLDNYESSTGIAETVTAEEEAENRHFLDAVTQTSVMQIAHKFLAERGLADRSPEGFKRQLYSIWFQLYSRDNYRGDSSGFEHVFVGETRRGANILGFHNWVQFYLQEKHGHVDYKGYKAQRSSRPDDQDHLLTLQFSWKGVVKPMGSSFIGVSPEFEMAVYTVCFLLSRERSSNYAMRLDEYSVRLECHRQGNRIGSSYPVLLASNLA